MFHSVGMFSPTGVLFFTGEPAHWAHSLVSSLACAEAVTNVNNRTAYRIVISFEVELKNVIKNFRR